MTNQDPNKLIEATQELAAPMSKTPILAGWIGTRTVCLPAIISVETLKLAQFFYYAGSLHTTSKIMEGLNAETEEDQLKLINFICDEMEAVRETIVEEMRERGKEVWGVTPASPITPESGNETVTARPDRLNNFTPQEDM